MARAQAAESAARARERLAEAGPRGLDALREALREARSLLESARLLLRDSLEQAKRRHREAEEEAERRRQVLEAEASALAEAVRRAGVEPPEPPRLGDVFEAVAALKAYLEELERLATETGVLRGRELEAYKLVALERRRRGELLFREAVALVAERLGLEPGEAKKLLLALIDKGVLEPRL